MSVITYGWLAPSGEYEENMGLAQALLYVKNANENGYRCRPVRYVDGEMDVDWQAGL